MEKEIQYYVSRVIELESQKKAGEDHEMIEVMGYETLVRVVDLLNSCNDDNHEQTLLSLRQRLKRVMVKPWSDREEELYDAEDDDDDDDDDEDLIP